MNFSSYLVHVYEEEDFVSPDASPIQQMSQVHDISNLGENSNMPPNEESSSDVINHFPTNDSTLDNALTNALTSVKDLFLTLYADQQAFYLSFQFGEAFFGFHIRSGESGL